MSEKVYKDYLPANARIVVDYNSKEKVKFSYPNEWTYRKAVWQRGYPTIACFWMSIHVIPLLYFLIYVGLPLVTCYIFYLFFTADLTTTTTYTYTYNYIGEILKQIAAMLGIYAIVFFYFFGIPAFITYYLSRDKEKLAEWVPKCGYWTAKVMGVIKEWTYTTEDVNNNKIVLSSFSNVYLNYQSTKDFAKYLQKIEIIEIPFNYIKRRFFMPFRKKKEYNEFVFRAVFFFSQKPIKGELKIEFR